MTHQKEEGSTVADTGQAKERVQDAAGQAKGRLSEQVDERSTQAGMQVNSMAEDVKSVAQELRTQGKDTPARYAEQAAERVQSAGQWLESSDGDKLLSDVEDFARRNPWAVAAGGLVLGLAASRLLKASSRERYRSTLSNDSGGAHGRTAPTGAPGSLAAEPMPSGASTGGGEFSRPEGSMISTEART
jgi:hypothetical protein